MAGGASLDKLVKSFSKLAVDQAKAQNAKSLADAQLVAAMMNFQGRQRQFGVDLASKAAEVRAAEAAAQGGEAPPPPEFPENPLPDVRNPLNGLPSNVAIPQAVAEGGPAGVAGGASVQQGMQQGGQSVEGFAVPPMIQSSQQTTQTQYAPHQVSPFMTEFVPLQTQQATVTSRPNVLTAAQAAQLKIARQQMLNEERSQQAAITQRLIMEGMGGESVAIANAIYNGDSAAVQRLMKGKTTLSQKQTEAAIRAEGMRAQLYQAQVGQAQVKTLIDLTKLQAAVNGTPFSVRNGLRSPSVASSVTGLKPEQLLTQTRLLFDKDGNVKKGLEAALADLKIEWADRGFLFLHEPGGWVGSGSSTPVPMADLINQAASAALGDPEAAQALLKGKLFVRKKEGDREILAPNPKLGPTDQRILGAVLNDGELRAKVQQKGGTPFPAQAVEPPKEEPKPSPQVESTPESKRGEAAGRSLIKDVAASRRANLKKVQIEEEAQKKRAREQEDLTRGFFRGILEELRRSD